MDDEPVIEKLPTDDVVEKFKVAYDLKVKALLLQQEAEAKQKLADELHTKARFWTRIAYGSLGVGLAAQLVNLIIHYLRTHP